MHNVVHKVDTFPIEAPPMLVAYGRRGGVVLVTLPLVTAELRLSLCCARERQQPRRPLLIRLPAAGSARCVTGAAAVANGRPTGADAVGQHLGEPPPLLSHWC